MLRNNSFLATVNGICSASKKKDVIKIGIIGEEGTGKTTMAKAIGHAIHEKMKSLYNIPFAVRIFYEQDLLEFRNTLSTLTPSNYVLIFDDISFLEGSVNKTQISAVKQAVTKIRHMQGGQDVKIILINNYHYTKGLDKYLRQANFKYFTSVGSEEGENLQKYVGIKNMSKIKQFIKYQDQILKTEPPYWSVKISAKDFFVYKWQDPFIPALFFDNINLRNIVSPTREFMSPVCSICSMAEGKRYSEVPIGELCNEGEAKFGERVFQSACKLKLFENGMAVHAKSTINAKRWLDIQLTKKVITLEQIMLHYKWNITKTHLNSKFSQLIDENKLRESDDTKPKTFKRFIPN